MDIASYILLGVAILGISLGVLRWIFRVNDHIQNQEIIIQLLSNILRKQGFTNEEIINILNPKKKK